MEACAFVSRSGEKRVCVCGGGGSSEIYLRFGWCRAFQVIRTNPIQSNQELKLRATAPIQAHSEEMRRVTRTRYIAIVTANHSHVIDFMKDQ